MKRWIAVLVIVWLFAGAAMNRDAFACELIPMLGFSPIAADVYVDDSIAIEHRQHILSTIAAGTLRVNNYYGAPLSGPRYIVTNRTDHIAFGLNPTAMQRSGLTRECIFLGPKGQNIDVVAHELVHAETRYRVSLLREMVALPTWFIEGIATVVDQRQPLLPQNIDLTEEQIAAIKQVHFALQWDVFNPSHYQAARMAIRPLQPKQLYPKLARIDQGESFAEVFPELL